jgi:hypothetical protein
MRQRIEQYAHTIVSLRKGNMDRRVKPGDDAECGTAGAVYRTR